MPRRLSLFSLFAGGVALPALCAGLAHAETALEGATTVEELTVTATRVETPVDEAPATVTVVTDEEIEEILATDIKDLVRFEPGVSVRAQPSRFTAALASTGRDGNAGFNIRGLDGNRVLIQVDGVRVPDGFTFGAQAVGRGDYADLDMIKSVEILRGPASSLYGSDGLAGAVSFVTKDPVDFLGGDSNFGARARFAYGSADGSFTESVALAGRSGAWSGLIAYTRRDASETETQGENDSRTAARTAANPQDVVSDAVLGKIVFAPSEAHRFRLTAEHLEREVVTEGYTGRSATVLDLDGRDDIARSRVSLDHRYVGDGAGPIDRFQTTLYWQQSETREWTYEDRTPAVDRIRDNTFDNEVFGLSVQGESGFGWMGVPHRLVYGVEASRTRQEGVRDGTVPPAGETFPSRPFPNTDYTLVGAFIQDEISLVEGRLKLYPALRFDHYELDPEVDALYPGLASGSEDSHLSPKFGAVYWSDRGVGLFASYAEGFKAPEPSQVNNGFSNPIFGYISIPNPDLKPESSRSVEGGVRFRDLAFAGGEWSLQTAAFAGWYEDFITQIGLTPPFPAACGAFALCFQYVNLGEVEIRGFEARAEADWENGFGFDAAVSFAEGEQVVAGPDLPLDSIDPFKVVAGLSWRDPGGRFGGQLIATYVGEKDVDDVSGACASPGPLVSADSCNDSFTLLDATAFWNVTDHATVRVGVFNITDETYSWWSDVRGVGPDSPTRDSYTQPGRNVSVSLVLRY